MMSECICTIIPKKYIFFGQKALNNFFQNNPQGMAFVLIDENMNLDLGPYNEKIKFISINQINKEILSKTPFSILNLDSIKPHLIHYIIETFEFSKIQYLDLFKWMYYPCNLHKLLPNYLYEIYKQRTDLQKAFPDPFGKDERGLVQWAKYSASNEYGIEQAFLELPLYGSLEWTFSPVHSRTVIPNLLYEVYKRRRDLQQTFPDPFGKDERNLLLWAQTYFLKDYKLKIDLRNYYKLKQLIPLKTSFNFLKRALTPVNNNTHLPNLLWVIYHSSSDLQRTFKDPLGKDQGKLLRWAQANLVKEFDIGENFLTIFMSQNPGFHFYQIVETFEGLKKLKKGVNLIGFARAELGVGEACRMIAKSLITTQIPFGIINYSQRGLKEGDLSWVSKEITEPIFKTNIIHINADTLPAVYQYYGESYFNYRYNIGFWHWELPDFPDEWCDRFKLVNEVWAPTHFVQKSIQRKANIPVHRIPLAVSIDLNNLFDRKYFGLPEDRFLFLAMYDTFSYQQRKNPWAAIHAFKRAFSKNDRSVGLVLKVNNALSFPSEIIHLKNAIKDYNNIYLIVTPLSRKEVNSLIQASNCFVSLHRSEGFGIVLAEAMYLGKPVIGTNWSGNTDFMTIENSCAVDYKLTKIGKDYGPYKHNQIWAEPDIEHAVYFMKKLVNDSAWCKSIGEKGQETIRKNFSPNAVGRLIENRLKELNLI
jgi:glycosyltransferase involved in cell wall biosynthesis